MFLLDIQKFISDACIKKISITDINSMQIKYYSKTALESIHSSLEPFLEFGTNSNKPRRLTKNWTFIRKKKLSYLRYIITADFIGTAHLRASYATEHKDNQPWSGFWLDYTSLLLMPMISRTILKRFYFAKVRMKKKT